MVTITYDTVKSQVTADDPVELRAAFHILDSRLSYHKKGYFFSPAYEMGLWDGKQHFFSTTTGLLYSGFISRALQVLKKEGFEYEVVGYPEPRDISHMDNDIVLPDGTVLYKHQANAVRQVCKYSRGVLRIATNGGKTEVAAGIIHAYAVPPTIYYVPRSVLVEQVASRLEKRLKIEVGRIGAGFNKPNPDGVTVAMTHTTSQKLKAMKKATRKAQRAEMVEQLQYVLQSQIVIGDECHLASDARYQESFEQAPGPVRVLMSGTPFKDDPVERGFVQAYGGPLLADVDNDYMVTQGISAKPNVMYIEPKIGLLNKTRYALSDYSSALMGCTERNKTIAALARAFLSCNLPFLVLVTKIEHAKAISEHIPEATVTHGSASNRKSVEKKLRSGDTFCCIATAIFDTGFDTPYIQGVAYASGGPDEIRVAQTLGRILRQNETRDKSPWFFDFLDTYHPILKRHSNARLKYFKRHHTFNLTEDFSLLPPGVYSRFVQEIARS